MNNSNHITLPRRVRLNPKDQANVPAKQYYDRDITKCDPPPTPTQLWMCPGCDQLHLNEPIYLVYYRCLCGWHGNRNALLTESRYVD